MLQYIYRRLIEPLATDPDQRNREVVLNWLLLGLVSLLLFFSVNGFIAYWQYGKDYILVACIMGLALASLSLLYSLLWRTNRLAQLITSNILIGFLITAAIFLVLNWGVNNPYGMLLFCLAIVMAGILVGARYSLYAALIIALILIIVEHIITKAIIVPDTSAATTQATLADALNFSIIFLIIALVSWLFNKQMEQSLHRARQSELELKNERDLLEVKVEERTRALQEAQLEKIQQVYKFAELGHLSTALFHDLAGNLSSLSIDIESMRKKGKADFTKRIDSNIHYIDSVVQRVKSQIQGKDTVETFDVIAETKDLVGILSYNARKARTIIELQTASPKRPVYFTGNLTRFRQLIINLLSNAIEAYAPNPDASSKERPVIITIHDHGTSIVIQVTDHGKGIQKATQAKIFDPFYTTKSTGSGIGLFIVRQVAENDFSGTINLRSDKKTGTTFTVTLPK